MTTLEHSKPADEARDPLPRSGAVSSCNDWLGRIICGDNTKVLDIVPRESVDLVITSPPYDSMRTYGDHGWDFERLRHTLAWILKPGGVLVWIVGDQTKDGDESGTSMRQALGLRGTGGLKLHDTMIYEKSGAFERHGHKTYPQAFEFMFVYAKGQPKTFNIIRDQQNSKAGAKHKPWLRQPDGSMKRGPSWGKEIREVGARTNIWRYNTGWTSAEEKLAFDHPAIMPEALAKDHILTWTNPGDVVLDPFCGSGTTCKAAKVLNRQWCGIEINPEYCKIAEVRMSQNVLKLEVA